MKMIKFWSSCIYIIVIVITLKISILSFFQKENVNKWQHDVPDVVSFEHFPADTTNDDSTEESFSPVTEDQHATAVADATAAAAEAAVAAAKVVRLVGYNGRRSKEERASIFIQSCYRGYLVTFIYVSHI